MKRFKFNLQSLLNYREHLEQVARQDMARVIQEVTASETRIQAFQATHDQWTQKLEALVKKGVSASQFKIHHDYLGAVTGMIVQEKQQKIGLDKILAENRVKLQKRSLDRKAMERLREKRAKDYHQELIVAEQKELDEISSLKRAREVFNE